MKSKTIVIIVLVAGFAVAVAFALMREVNREEKQLGRSISGVVEVSPKLVAEGVADVVKTDRLVLILVDPETRKPVAMHFESPLVPPQTIRIGEADTRPGTKLNGRYLLVGITDKDGEIFKVSPGEIYGRLPDPVALGTEKVTLTLDQPFRGSLFNEASAPVAQASSAPQTSQAAEAPQAAGPQAANPPAQGPAMMASPGADDADPRYTIRGTVSVVKKYAKDVATTDHVVILLFDPDTPRPVAFKVIPHAFLPQAFSISLPPDARAHPKAGYFLHVITDKDNSPFGSAPGELAGRSAKPVPLGTTGLDFKLDQPYKR